MGVFFLVDTYTPDVFSTDVRNFTFCFLDSISKIGTTIAPFIIYLGNLTGITGASPAIFGLVLLCSSFCLLFTPETKGIDLAQTVEELDKHGKPSLFSKMKKSL